MCFFTLGEYFVKKKKKKRMMQKTQKPKLVKLNCTLHTRYNGFTTINILQMAFSRIINNVEMLYGRIIKQ